MEEDRDLLTEMFTKKFGAMTYHEKNTVYRFVERMEDVKELAKRGDIPKDELETLIEKARHQDELMLLLLLYKQQISENDN